MPEIPYIDKVYWEEVNTVLSQLMSPLTGGIHLWNQSNPRPSNLTPANEGLTGWNTSTQNLERWTGNSWLTLTYSSEMLRPIVNAFLKDNGSNLQPTWLKDLIANQFLTWAPSTLPSWILNAFNTAINNIPTPKVFSLLNSWNPDPNSPLGIRIQQASASGGMNPQQFSNLFANWPHAIPNWLISYVTALLTNKTWSSTVGEASYQQLLPPLTEWFNNWLKGDINSRLAIGGMQGAFTFQQILPVVEFWFNSNLKAYIDNGDNTSRQYINNIFTSLEQKENQNREDILNRLAAHTHNTNNVVPSNFTGYAAWPNNQANYTNQYNVPVIIGACITDRLSGMQVNVHPFDFGSSVFGSFSARMKVVMLPSSAWPDKSGVNNSPNGITTSGLLSATSNIFTISGTNTSSMIASTTNFSHISSDNCYFIYLIFERVWWPEKYINAPVCGVFTLFKSDGSVLMSTMTSGPTQPNNMKYHTFYGYYNGPGESTP